MVPIKKSFSLDYWCPVQSVSLTGANFPLETSFFDDVCTKVEGWPVAKPCLYEEPCHHKKNSVYQLATVRKHFSTKNRIGKNQIANPGGPSLPRTFLSTPFPIVISLKHTRLNCSVWQITVEAKTQYLSCKHTKEQESNELMPLQQRKGNAYFILFFIMWNKTDRPGGRVAGRNLAQRVNVR